MEENIEKPKTTHSKVAQNFRPKAEGVGVEPTCPFGRRFSKPVAYHSPQPSCETGF